MQIPEIKRLVENHSIEDLTEAENALMEELELPFEIKGSDDGEVLTHIIAAVWILEKMESHELPFAKALREYTQKVRTSIS
ncbi:MAG: hypothetical protein JXR07_10035 [Reichenbachiella sp.]